MPKALAASVVVLFNKSWYKF